MWALNYEYVTITVKLSRCKRSVMIKEIINMKISQFEKHHLYTKTTAVLVSTSVCCFGYCCCYSDVFFVHFSTIVGDLVFIILKSLFSACFCFFIRGEGFLAYRQPGKNTQLLFKMAVAAPCRKCTLLNVDFQVREAPFCACFAKKYFLYAMWYFMNIIAQVKKRQCESGVPERCESTYKKNRSHKKKPCNQLVVNSQGKNYAPTFAHQAK